jgi:hypothetical protein
MDDVEARQRKAVARQQKALKHQQETSTVDSGESDDEKPKTA